MLIQLETRPVSPRNIVRSGLCIGCGVCVTQTDDPGPHMEMNGWGQYEPVGDAGWYRRPSARFSEVCPFSPRAASEDELSLPLYPDNPLDPSLGRFESAYVGWVSEGDFRAGGSSGGMVSWVLAELMRQGLIDGAAHVVRGDTPQTDGYYRYRISRTQDEIREGAKSRYYPVEMSRIIETIRATPGRYAVVGVPCFIKAIQLLRRTDPVIRDRVRFTLGLFCGHMKSAQFVDSFAWQMDVSPDDVQRVEYRLKDPTRAASTYTAQLTLRDGQERRKDWWNLCDGDWGAGYFQYSACNWCDDVVGETADISFGDAWVEPYSSDGRGTNVVVVRAPRLGQIVRDAIREERLHLEPVDSRFIHDTQAAGFRQRREGLAYRLTWPRLGLRIPKRVTPSRDITPRRKLIYVMRALISWSSHHAAFLARRTNRPEIYTRWARWALTTYHGLAYSRGTLGEKLKRWGLRED